MVRGFELYSVIFSIKKRSEARFVKDLKQELLKICFKKF